MTKKWRPKQHGELPWGVKYWSYPVAEEDVVENGVVVVLRKESKVTTKITDLKDGTSTVQTRSMTSNLTLPVRVGQVWVMPDTTGQLAAFANYLGERATDKSFWDLVHSCCVLEEVK